MDMAINNDAQNIRTRSMAGALRTLISILVVLTTMIMSIVVRADERILEWRVLLIIKARGEVKIAGGPQVSYVICKRAQWQASALEGGCSCFRFTLAASR
jgi:hypothetical protein